MEMFKQQTPFDVTIIDSSGTFLGVMEFSTVSELCRHIRHHGLPEGQAFCLAGLDLRGGYLRQAQLAGADMTKCNLEERRGFNRRQSRRRKPQRLFPQRRRPARCAAAPRQAGRSRHVVGGP